MNSLTRLTVVLVVLLFALAGCAGCGHKKNNDAEGPSVIPPPPVEEPPVVIPPPPVEEPPVIPPSPVEEPPVIPPPPPVSGTGALTVAINPDGANSGREWYRIKVSGTKLLVPLFVDTLPSETSALVGTMPTGPVTVEVTAWKDVASATGPNGVFGPILLSSGEVEVDVLPCAEPCSTPTLATVTLAPSNAVVTSPSGFVYGSSASQEVSAQVSFTNYPLGFRQAEIRAYVTDYPAIPQTVFTNLCTGSQMLIDTTVRGCTGTLLSTSKIKALTPGSVRALVFVNGSAHCRDFEDGNGCTLLPKSSNFGFRDFVLISNPLPNAP